MIPGTSALKATAYIVSYTFPNRCYNYPSNINWLHQKKRDLKSLDGNVVWVESHRPHQNCLAISFWRYLIRQMSVVEGRADSEQTSRNRRDRPATDMRRGSGLDDHRHRPRRRELLNQVRVFFRNISPGGSNSSAHLPGLFCCHAKLISQKFGLQLHHFVDVLGIH